MFSAAWVSVPTELLHILLCHCPPVACPSQSRLSIPALIPKILEQKWKIKLRRTVKIKHARIDRVSNRKCKAKIGFRFKKTPGYRRKISSPQIFLKMRFTEKLPFYMRSKSYLSLYPNFQKFRNFFKAQNFVSKKALLKIQTFYPHSPRNFLLFANF